MGIPRGTARLLLDEARERAFGGALLELGRMTVYVTEAELRGWAAEQRVGLTEVRDVSLSHQAELARHGCLDDRSFFRLLGFETVEAFGDQIGLERRTSESWARYGLSRDAAQLLLALLNYRRRLLDAMDDFEKTTQIPLDGFFENQQLP